MRRTYYVVLTRDDARAPYWVVGPLTLRDAAEMVESFLDTIPVGWLPPTLHSRTNVAALARWARRNGIDTFFVPELLLQVWNYDALLLAIDITRDITGLNPVRSLRDLPALEREEMSND